MNSKWKLTVGALALVGVGTLGKLAATPAFANGDAARRPLSRNVGAKVAPSLKAQDAEIGTDREDGGDESGDEAITARLSLKAALDLAAERVPGAYVNSARLEDENGRKVWTLEAVTAGGGKSDIVVDAEGGNIVSVKADAPDAPTSDKGDGDGETNDGPGTR